MKQLKDGDIDEITAKNQYETKKEFYVFNSI
ncbi:hypothetical protein SJDPG2_09595 [Porphyromonas gingivalis SJD2]|nr:hypothetical protein SJDPG2_09595 [Porphyromonas gingivalis SJD2]OWR76334.1 hypothetical protein SJDPG5_07990 [Porphyromonas gingivalis SJD5]